MATRRHGINAAVFVDDTSAGTNAVGTSTLTQLTSAATWTFDQSRDFVDVTSFGDSSHTDVAGLANAAGSVTGFHDFGGSLIFNAFASSTERGLMIFPDYINNKTTYISGKAFLSPKFGGGVTAAVTEEFDFRAGPTGLTWTHP